MQTLCLQVDGITDTRHISYSHVECEARSNFVSSFVKYLCGQLQES